MLKQRPALLETHLPPVPQALSLRSLLVVDQKINATAFHPLLVLPAKIKDLEVVVEMTLAEVAVGMGQTGPTFMANQFYQPQNLGIFRGPS